MSQPILPVAPGIIMQVTQVAADPSSSATDLARVIQKEPVLSAQVIRAVNSAYYSPCSRVSSVQRAVSFMGTDAVRNLVLCLVIRELFPARDDFSLELFWECSLRRAAAARCLATRLCIPDTDEIFTLSLCQDIGVLVHLHLNPKIAPRVNAAMSTPAAARLEVEEREDGKRHDDLAYELFQNWRFPEDLAVPIRYHHRPAAAPKQHATRARLAHAAEAIADLFEVADKHGAIRTASVTTKAAGLAFMDLDPLMEEVGEVVTIAAEMLQITVGQQPTYEQIMEMAIKGLESLGLDLEGATALLQKAMNER